MLTRISRYGTLWFALTLLCALVLACAGCNGGAKAAGPPGGGTGAFPVKVQKVELQKVGDYAEYIATLKSRDSTLLQPQVEGQITQIYVHSGDHVAPGQRILEIDPTKQQATVHSQEATRQSKMATLELAKTELERRKQLAAAGVVSQQDLEQAQTAYDSAKADAEATNASVREQEVQLKYYFVTAPTAGIIGDIPVRVGDHVTSATQMTTIDRSPQLEAYLSLPAEKSGQVHIGTPVEILDDSGQPSVRCAVTFVSPRVDPQTQLLLVKAMVPNEQHRFRNDQLVHARVIWKEMERPVIPVTSVTRLSGQTFAFVAEGEKGKTVAHQVAIKVGDTVGNNYVVLDGIKPGDQVILSGVQMLVDGMPVEPQA